jgi:hypothetical protein
VRNPSRRRAAFPILAALSLSLVISADSAWANGGTPRLAAASAGPYAVSVWTQPDPPRVGELDTSVAVMHPDTGAPVPDATVRVSAEPLEGTGKSASTPARRGTGGNLLLHHATLTLPGEGRWRVTVRVEGSKGSGSASFDLHVGATRSSWWLGATVATLLVFLLLLISWRHIYRPASSPN